MSEKMLKQVLDSIQEFREEQNQKWKQNDKRWEQNEKRWEQNEKRWQENEKRWEQNEKRWLENEKRWEQNEKRWQENEERWKGNSTLWSENTKILKGMENRIKSLEEGRVKDRVDILSVLETMQQATTKQFEEMREHFDAKFEKVFAAQRLNEIEHKEFREILYSHGRRLDFQNARLNNLERWKEEFEMGNCTMV